MHDMTHATSMPARLHRSYLTLLVGICGCGAFGSDAAVDGAEADLVPDTIAEVVSEVTDVQAPEADAETDTVSALSAAAEEAGSPESGGDAQDQADQSVEERLDRILAGQEALSRRLDSLTAEAAPDSGRTLDGGQVLGEAGRRVQNFGVAVMWSVILLVVFNFLVVGTVWVLDSLAERNAARRLLFKRLVPVVRMVLWIFAAYLIVRVIFQVDAQGIFAAAAAIGVAIGFASQDLLKNLFGGLILVFDQPFQVGDKISVGETYGEVVSIGLRSTRIVTPDDNLVSVPNAHVVDQQVANANAGQLNCQVVTDLYLPGWADEESAKRIAFDAAATSKYVYLNKPIVIHVADVFKETFLTRVRVKAYVLDPRLEGMFRSDVTERARAGFREAGLLRPEHMLTSLVHNSAVGVAAGDEAQEANGERG
jgi:small-conductance mechanosensitive channel